MALGARRGACVSAGGFAGTGFAGSWGMTMVSPHVGHGSSEPAPAESTDNSWLQLGQLKMISIGVIWVDYAFRLAAWHFETNKKF